MIQFGAKVRLVYPEGKLVSLEPKDEVVALVDNIQEGFVQEGNGDHVVVRYQIPAEPNVLLVVSGPDAYLHEDWLDGLTKSWQNPSEYNSPSIIGNAEEALNEFATGGIGAIDEEIKITPEMLENPFELSKRIRTLVAD